MNLQGLQTDKLVPIELPEICAPRLELLGRFDKASAKRCIYVGAPAGCGKTVSTLLWIRKSGCTPIWLGLDVYDNTPAAFYRFFCTALFSVIPQEENLSRIIMDPAFSNSPVEYTIEVVSRFSFAGERYVLVLDDFHFITNEEILKSLIYILKRLPLSVTVIFLSRSELPRFFAPLAENGKVTFIDASELAFKSDEIRRFFSSHGQVITEEEAEQVFSLTEGWAIAVNALALSGNITADQKLKDGLLDKYIETQIWNKFDEDLRLFLIRTSVVDEFSIKLCKQLTQNSKAKQVLDMLCNGNMFISRHDDKYRYHHVFLDFLRMEAAKETAIGYEVLYQKAADYYFDKGDYFNALRYFVRAEDRKGTATALHHFWKYTGKSSSEIAKVAFLKELPEAVLEQNPYLYIGCAWYALLFSDVKKFFFYLDKLYERIQDIAGEHKMFMENVLFLFTVDPRYSFVQQLSRLQTGGALTLENFNIPKSLNHNFPFFHRTYRDYSHYALNTEERFAEFRHTFFMMLGSDYPIIEAGVRSGLLYEKNRLKEAFSLVTPNPATDSVELKFLSKMHIASCLFALGREEDSARCRAKIKVFLEKENLFHLLPVFSAYETKIKLLDGDKAAAAAWLDNYFVNETQDIKLHKLFLHFTTVRAYMVLGEFKKAQLLCERIIALSRDFGRLLDRIEATTLLIILTWMTDKKKEAAVLLQATLADTEPYHFIRVFADEGKAILPVLKKLIKKSGLENEATPGYKYMQEVYLAAYAQAKRHKGITCASAQKPLRLSKQQKYILELLAKGYKNAEIVELTGLSINTIRTHTKTAYQKLEVGTAMDAVLRARELELIE